MTPKPAIFIICVLLLIKLLNANPQIQLPDGPITGREAVTVNNKTYYAFEKIPYAAPPIGELRFKAPIPPAKWEDPLDTLELDVSCYQTGYTFDYETEDCLYLSVFTPELPSGNNEPSLPVMVFLYGGGFVRGSALLYRSDFIVEEDVILVVLNYRVGPMGFLSTQDDVIPGNNGLKDQQFAVKWVHDNIQLFGGDPDKITLFGQSAGSASVSYQLLNQKSRGLFRGAILESGTAITPWAFQRNARKIAFRTAAFLNDSFLESNDSAALLEFLLTVDGKDLDVASEDFHTFEYNPEDVEILQGFYWAPVIEVKNPDAFLTKKMYPLLEAGNTVGVPIMMGMTSEESVATGDLEKIMSAFDTNLAWVVPNDMHIENEDKRAELGRQIREIYTGGDPFSEQLGNAIRYSSDTSFTRSIIKHAELYSNFFKTYFYQFSYAGKLWTTTAHYENASTVGHAADLNYIFCMNSGCNVSGYPESDQITVQRLVKLWTNFAKYLNPTPEPDELFQNITWPLLSTKDGDFLYLNINDTLEIRNHPREETYSKWVELYDGLQNQNFDTY